jgi:hypothetical protein
VRGSGMLSGTHSMRSIFNFGAIACPTVAVRGTLLRRARQRQACGRMFKARGIP